MKNLMEDDKIKHKWKFLVTWKFDYDLSLL